MVTIEGALDELGHFLEYHILSRRGGEHLVKFERVILANVLAQYGEALAVGENIDGGMTRRGAVTWQEWPRAHVNANIAPQLLDAVVQRATVLLSSEEHILELSNPAIAFFDPPLQDGWVLVRCARY